MGTRIATNVDSLRALVSLQQSTAFQSQTLSRLSTGTQINSGRDNPSGLIGSQTLNSQITAIQQSITNSNRANNVIGTADGALGEVGNLLNQIRGLVQGGVNQGALSSAEIQANQAQIDAALSAINQISSNTVFAGSKLLDGSKAFTTVVSTADSAKLNDFQINQALFGSATSVTVNSEVVTAATKGSLTYNAGNLTTSTTLQISGSKGSQVLFFGDGSTYTNLANAINNVSDVTGVSASITTAATASELVKVSNGESLTVGAANAALTYTGVRSNGDDNNPISVTYAVAGNNTALSVSVTGNAITVNVATDGNGAATSTANQILAAVSGNAQANALVSVALATGSDGTSVVAAAASADLTGGTNNDVNFVDARQNAGASDSTISVAYVNGGANQTLSATVTDTAISINLATDANGNVTTTANDIATFITSDTSAGAIAARALVSATAGAGVEGDGTGVVTASAAENLSGGANATLTLTSLNFGSAEFVDVSNLTQGASFATYDGSSQVSRSTGTDIIVRINGQTAYGQGLKASISTSLLDASVSFDDSYNVVGASAAITITGGGSLFQIGQNVATSGQLGVGIEAVNTAKLGGVAGKLYQLGSGAGSSLLDVGKTVQGSTLVDIISQALDRVNTLRARLGGLQTNVIQSNINSLGVALQNISDAKSQIADTDYAQETANLTKSQILNQAGISALQIANSAPQLVLSLLRQ